MNKGHNTNTMKSIQINGRDYKIKYSIRALFIFENITGKAFRIDTLLDNYIFFYSMILANNKDGDILQWDEFLDAIDNDPKLFQKMADIVEETEKKNELFEKERTEGDGEKKS